MQVKEIINEKENLLSQLNTQLQTRDDLLVSMKKVIALKSARVTKLEADANELVQKAETLEKSNEKYTKDLIWARNYCLKMNDKVKEMEICAPATNQIRLPNGNFYPLMNSKQAQFIYDQKTMILK